MICLATEIKPSRFVQLKYLSYTEYKKMKSFLKLYTKLNFSCSLALHKSILKLF